MEAATSYREAVIPYSASRRVIDHLEDFGLHLSSKQFYNLVRTYNSVAFGRDSEAVIYTTELNPRSNGRARVSFSARLARPRPGPDG